jgi:hypothetical protein
MLVLPQSQPSRSFTITLARGLGVLLHEGRADEGRYHAPALAADMRQYVAHEVDPGAVEEVPRT